jgi:hypothetical protein
MKPACPAAATCQWHNRALLLIQTGQIEQLQEDREILLVLLSRAWRACTCGLAKRVRALL